MLTIGSWWLLWKLLDSNQSSANGVAWCTTTRRGWGRWMENSQRILRSSNQSGRVAFCLFFSMSLLWSPYSVGLGMRSPALHSILFQVSRWAVRMVIWMMRNFSHRDLILFFRHQLKVKIRCDRKCLDCIIFDRRWVHAASLVVRKRAML